MRRIFDYANIYIPVLPQIKAMSFHCEKCRYKSERERIPEKCPYCGTPGTIHKNETAADLIIQSA